MDTRREFIKKAGLLAGMTGLHAALPASIQRALAIEPVPGSTWQDAEHIVFLMQENRSFDHCYGSLRGVRGFNDPRAIQLPNGNPVWLQSDQNGKTFAPFHLDIKDTRATWMNSLPHSWSNQVNARNDGKYDQWLPEKKSHIEEYAGMPLTMGYYNRDDIPFYYALADGFTVCDQHFCSSLTGTTPNRLFFWTGTIRAEQNDESRAMVWNDDADYESLHWKTFPEILEENGVSWKFYQNEISVDVGFKDEEGAWLANFGDNPLEYFAQYRVRMHEKHLNQLQALSVKLPTEIRSLQQKADLLSPTDPAREGLMKNKEEKQKLLDDALRTLKTNTPEKRSALSEAEKNIHKKAFATNTGDPDYHQLEEIVYDDQGISRRLKLPKGDLFHQFRQDVQTGKLPTVSWLAAPENLSDHPTSAWYGAWYVSEVMDILTKNPEIWRKTIFVLTYDENDGYFDHMPPFVAPHSDRPETGTVSPGMDTRVEYVTVAQEKERNGFPVAYERESPIGLGYRVPLVVASPWSRGGFVNSQVFDHSSSLQFLETFLSKKTGKPIHCPLISEWRRTVCGNLTSLFRPADKKESVNLDFLKRNDFMESVYNARFKKLPSDFTAITPAEMERIKNDPRSAPWMSIQEPGIRPSCGLYYQLEVDGRLTNDKSALDIQFLPSDRIFGTKALGAAFQVYAPGKYRSSDKDTAVFENMRSWSVTARPSNKLVRSWPLASFENGQYFLRVYGPNGFFRELKGSAADPGLGIACEYDSGLNGNASGNIRLRLQGLSESLTVDITDNAYKMPAVQRKLDLTNNKSSIVLLDLSKQFGWYDFTIKVSGHHSYERRYAGRVETGESGWSDPFMGKL